MTKHLWQAIQRANAGEDQTGCVHSVLRYDVYVGDATPGNQYLVVQGSPAEAVYCTWRDTRMVTSEQADYARYLLGPTDPRD